MTTTCPDHGTMLLQYLRGQLDDAGAARAEALLTECPSCSAWFGELPDLDGLARVEHGVAEGLRTVTLAKPRHRLRWIAAAAVLFAVSGSLWMAGPSVGPNPSIEPDNEARIATFDFEGAMAQGVEVANRQGVSTAVPDSEPLFEADLEDGGLGSWSVHS